MATIEIRDVLDNETGKTIFPRTHVDAVIGLEDSSYFEKVQDADDPTKFSIKLKSEYTGLWAEGWIAAGGIGSGGGGGGGGLIREVLGLSSLGSVQAEDLTKTFSAYAIDSIYKQVQDLEDRIDGSGLLGGYLKTSDGGFFLTSEGQKILLKGSGGIGASSLSDLTDTSIYNPLEGDLLVWSGASWVNVRQSTIKPDLSGYATTEQLNELNERIRSLAESILWELDSDNNVTLKSGHSNAWVPGWLAAGGVGSESGGGGASALYDLVDVSVAGRVRGDILVYDGTHWVNTPQSSIVPSVSISFSDLTTHPTTIAGYGITDAKIVNGTITLGGETIKPALASELLSISTRVGNIESWFEIVTVNGAPALHAKGGMAIYSDSWIAAGGVGEEGQGGSVVSISNLLSSGTRVATLTIDGEAYDIFAPSGGSGGSTVSWGTQSGNTIPLSVDGTSKTLLLSGALSGYATQSWVGDNYLPLAGGQLTGDLRLKPSSSNYGSTLRFGDGNYAYIQEDTDDHLYFYASKGMNFETGSGYDITLNGVSISDIVTLSTAQTITGAKTFSTNPVTIASDSGISVNAASYIDIGNARIIYDSGTNALHITKKSGTSATIGLYADGFVAAGGVAGQTTASYVDLESNQEIGGNKTFLDNFSVEGNAYFDVGITMSGDLDIDSVIISTGNVNGVNGLTVSKNALFTWMEGSVIKSVTIKDLLDRIVALENSRWVGTQAQYDALGTYDSNVEYLITES